MNLFISLCGRKEWSLKGERKMYFYVKCDLFYVNITSFAQVHERADPKQCNYVNWIQAEGFFKFQKKLNGLEAD